MADDRQPENRLIPGEPPALERSAEAGSAVEDKDAEGKAAE